VHGSTFLVSDLAAERMPTNSSALGTRAKMPSREMKSFGGHLALGEGVTFFFLGLGFGFGLGFGLTEGLLVAAGSALAVAVALFLEVGVGAGLLVLAMALVVERVRESKSKSATFFIGLFIASFTDAPT
jgi:hypothetical protein